MRTSLFLLRSLQQPVKAQVLLFALSGIAVLRHNLCFFKSFRNRHTYLQYFLAPLHPNAAEMNLAAS